MRLSRLKQVFHLISVNVHLISTNLLPILGLLFRLYSAFSLRLFLTVLKQISLRMTWLKSKEFGYFYPRELAP